MTTTTIKKEVDDYLPLLSLKQQTLVLEMIKGFLNLDNDVKRISLDQYNHEIEEATKRIDQGEFVTHEDALKQLSKW